MCVFKNVLQSQCLTTTDCLLRNRGYKNGLYDDINKNFFFINEDFFFFSIAFYGNYSDIYPSSVAVDKQCQSEINGKLLYLFWGALLTMLAEVIELL